MLGKSWHGLMHQHWCAWLWQPSMKYKTFLCAGGRCIETKRRQQFLFVSLLAKYNLDCPCLCHSQYVREHPQTVYWMFGWKVQTAREAQQTSEEVRCSDYSDCVHCTRMHQFLLQRPRVRSCFWHGSISYDIWFIWCCTCERSNTHTQTHKHTFTLFKVVAFFAICNEYTQYRKMHLILCAWVWQGNMM